MRCIATLSALLFLVSLTPAWGQTCDAPCQNGGTCRFTNGTDASCDCTPFHEGIHCEFPWSDNKSFMQFVVAYQVTVALTFALVAAWCGWELYKAFFNDNGWEKISVITYSISIFGLGALLYSIIYAIDPHGLRNIISPSAFFILSTICIAMWISAAYGIALFWVQLNASRGKNQITFLHGLKPLLAFMIVMSWALLIASSIWVSLIPGPSSYIFYATICVFVVTIYMVLTIVFGVKLTRQMKDSKLSNMRSFMMRIIKHMIAISILCCLILVFSVTLTATVGQNRGTKYAFIAFWWVICALEAGLCLSALFLFRRRQSKASLESQHTSLPSSREENTPIKINLSTSMSQRSEPN
ncbi:hypothetical protein PROFUN_08244 [Planoprotostelium fungivorum]|uniref:EGF-like domain-containing protein n=1 Tax=Planoprotostelium fungivorum TaxID=1890364 RepID=A0A2P6NKC7_9EUKA|nr:hypothetical protein PROFUN_08244 [Planoprotostelium fungivorum]